MEADAAAEPTLLYVSDPVDETVYVLALPSGKLVGRLAGLLHPYGMCVDPKGNVFVVDSGNDIREYKHGAKIAFKILYEGPFADYGCSVDPTTENLAVVNTFGPSGEDGNIAIYSKARGTPQYYSDPPIFQYGFCAYDGLGNLYIDGAFRSSGGIQFAVLPSGRSCPGTWCMSPAA